MKIDPKIDALFQLPLDEFTQKRNALAKELAGESKKQVKFLTKPPLPIWAVNQLYWHDRPTYNALIDASEKLRTAHRSLLSGLSGPKADIRKAEHVHRAALAKAVSKTIALLEQSQEHISDAARETLGKALAALPTDEAPGRLTRAPEAAGFSLLTGLTGAAGLPRRSTSGAKAGAAGLPRRSTLGAKAGVLKEAAAKAEADARRRAEAAVAAKAAAREKEIAAAERDLRQARKSAEQAKFKVRKLSVDLERAQADEEKRAAEVSAAERKVSRLRIAPAE